MAKTSRERLIDTLNHRDPGKVVLDMGSTSVTGININALIKLRKGLGLEDRVLTMDEPLQLLGRVDEDVRDSLGIDVVGISNGYTIFGYQNRDWKECTLQNGLKMMVSEEFRTSTDELGNIYTYAKGDTRYPPSGIMPKDGFYFDNITRSDTTADDDDLDARRDFKDDFALFSDEELRYIQDSVDDIWNNTGYGMIYNGALCGIGDFAIVPGPHVPEPKGIRDLQEFMMVHIMEPNYIHDLFEMHLEFALKKAEQLYQAVGNKIQAVHISGTDFGLQRGPFMSSESFQTFYKPIYTRINRWIHENTQWKTFFHSCGSIVAYLKDFYECGADILNPVQTSAVGMDPVMLKRDWGDKFVFWGGGINTQQTLPFGTPEECYDEVMERLKVFAPGGGYIFNTVHNIQGQTPMENMVAMFQAIKDYNRQIGATD
jgi:hypothetical protein